MSRFVVSAPPSGPALIPVEEKNPVFPMTLDLRWPSPNQAAASPLKGVES
jgi:hypothetical protein